jgi:C-terminal processing protease CtpA/Prc
LSAGVGAALFAAGPAWSQAPEAPPASAAEEAAESAENTADEAKEAAQEAAQDTREAAQEANEESRDAAREANEDARDAARETRDDVQDAAAGTREAARDTADAARNAARDATGAARGPARDAADAARDTARDARGAAQNTRDAARDARQAVGDAARDVNVQASAQSFRVEDYRPADIGLWFDATPRQGLVISDIGSSGAITNLGFRPGDRIMSVNGQRVVREADFMNYLFAPDLRDQRVKVVVNRQGRDEIVFVEPATLIREVTTVHHDPLEDLGVVLDDRYQDRALVWKVIRRSPAFYGGVRAGDVITAINRQRIATAEDAEQIAARLEPGPVVFEVNRNDQPRTVRVEVTREVAPAVRVEQRAYRPELPLPAVPPAAVPTTPANPDVRPDRFPNIGPDDRPNRPGILPRRRQP